jgi:parallel beta-helix repeat protein
VNGVVVDGFTVSGCASNGFYFNGAEGCVVTNGVATNNAGDGANFLLSVANRLAVCDLQRNGSDGVHFMWSGNSEVRASRLHHNTSAGFRGAWVSGAGRSDLLTVRECMIYENGSDGLLESDGDNACRNWLVTNCVVYRNTGRGIYAGHTSSMTVRNTIVANNTTYGFSRGWNNGAIAVFYNDAYGNGSANYDPNQSPPVTPDANSISVDPVLVLPGSGEFHLYVGSPCIGAGSGGLDMGSYPNGPLTPLPAPVTYYVRTNGHDTATGTNNTPDPATGAFLTLQRAASAVFVPGDTVLVQPGRYAGGVALATGGAGTNPIVFRAAGSVAVTGVVSAFVFQNVSGVRLDGFTISGCSSNGILMTNSSSCTIMNCTVASNGADGIELVSSDNNRIMKCDIFGNAVDGVHFYASGGNEVDDTRLRDNGAYGIHGGLWAAGRSDAITIRQCLVYRNGNTGIFLDGDSTCQGWLAENCTLYRNYGSGANASHRCALTVRNCIVFTNSVYGLTRGWNAGVITPAFNDVYGNVAGNYSGGGELVTPDTNSISVDPSLAYPNSGDFRLRPDSPCVNAGTNQAWMAAAQDFAGNARIVNYRVDIGAHEYVTKGTAIIVR